MTHKVTEMISRNKLVYSVCNSKSMGSSLCYNVNFLETACHLFPWATMKLVRLRLKHLEPALQQEKLNAHIIFLVRDPRGVMNSRGKTVQWCNSKDCYDPELVCNDMDDDYTTALALQKQFPGKVHILRYEDLSLNPMNETRRLLNEIGLDFDRSMETFIKTHTTKNLDKPWSTSRESAKRVTYWTTKLPEGKLTEIQSACENVMKKLGYIPVSSMSGLTVSDVLKPIPL